MSESADGEIERSSTLAKKSIAISKESDETTEAEENLSNTSGDSALDEDDLELIRDNLGQSDAHAYEGYGGPSQRFKRLRRHLGNEPEHPAVDDASKTVAVGRKRRKAAGDDNDLARLFDEDELTAKGPSQAHPDDDAAALTREHALYSEYDEDEDEDDDLGDFIEEDLEAEDDDATRLSRDKTKAASSAQRKPKLMAGLKAPSGVSKAAWQDVLDIFGDGFEYTEHESETDDGKRERQKHVASSLKPAGMPERILTNKDAFIRDRDLPERMQLRDCREEAWKTPGEGELDDEAHWILPTLIRAIDARKTSAAPEGQTGDQEDHQKELAVLHAAIVSVLRFLRVEALEVPFIATHRKEYFEPDLSLNELWLVYDEDERWQRLDAKRSKAARLVERTAGLEDGEKIELAEFLAKANDEAEIKLVLDYLALVGGANEGSGMSSSPSPSPSSTPTATPVVPKRPSRQSAYKVAQAAGLDTFAMSFLLDPSTFMNSLGVGGSYVAPPTPSESPEMAAMRFLRPGFASTEVAVLDATVKMAAVRLAHHPLVMHALKKILRPLAILTTMPTEKGKRELVAAYEPVVGYKYLSDKPVGKLVEDQFLLIKRAVAGGDLKYSIGFQEGEQALDDFKRGYAIAGSQSSDSDDWARLRGRVFDEAVNSYIKPALIVDIENGLVADAERWVSIYCQYALQDQLMVAPMRHKNEIVDGERQASDIHQHIAAISWGEGGRDAQTFAVLVDEDGRIIEHARFIKLADRRQKPTLEWIKLKEWLVANRPSAIAVAGMSAETRILMSELEAIVKKHNEKAEHAEGDFYSIPWPVYVDDSVARIYMNSARGHSEFPEHLPLQRYAVSLARRLQNPLWEFCALASSEEELLALSLHPLQAAVSGEKRARLLARALINVVNLIGIDVNHALKHANGKYALPYVSGLGPRKTGWLIKALQKDSGMLGKRADLLGKGLVGRNVFTNSAAFLRVCASTLAGSPSAGRKGKFGQGYDGPLTVEPLDDTRIHPDDYPLARKMAIDALDLEETGMMANHDARNSDDESQRDGSAAVVELLRQPMRLDELLLEEYARELHRRTGIPKHITLLDIKAELQNPYADPRTEFRGLDSKEAFEMVTGLNEQAGFYIGALVSAIVIRLTDRNATVKLECGGTAGVLGILPTRNLPPIERQGKQYSARLPLDVLSMKQVIRCCVERIDYEKMLVEVSARPEDLRAIEEPRGGYDQYYDFERAAKDRQPIAAALGQPRASTTSSLSSHPVYQHPMFKNVSKNQAEVLLASNPSNIAILRPSSKGDAHLALTWKVAEGLFQHVDVRLAESTEPGSAGSLWIGEERYEDADELFARYVEMINGLLSEATAFPKYLSVPLAPSISELAFIEEHLSAERCAKPNRIAYCVSLSHERPGCLRLSYLAGDKRGSMISEHIPVLPSGFRFRDTLFDSVYVVITHLKTHFK